MTERRLPLAFGNTGTGTDADQNDIVQKGAGGLWVTRGPGEMILPGRYLLRTVYRSGSALTHTLNALTTKFRVYGQGAGTGGGGTGATNSSQVAIATAGTSGAYFDHIFTVAIGIGTLTYTVGLGGAGGIGNNPGGVNNVSTTVTYNSVTVGGTCGALAGLGGSPSTFFPRYARTAGFGTVIGSPDFSCAGGIGEASFALDINNFGSGMGGWSVLARGGPGTAFGGPGSAGQLGGGGSGASAGPSTGALNGGAGGDGILVIEEYS